MITRTIELTEQSDGIKVKSVWNWSPQDEYVVRVEFIGERNSVVWEFDRQIVIDGIDGEAGLLDVRLRRIGMKTLQLRLSSPDGSCLFECPRGELRAFVKGVMAALPEQRLPSDDELAKILAKWSTDA